MYRQATSVMEEEEGGDAAGADVIIDVDDDDGSGSGSGLAETIMDAVEDIVNATQVISRLLDWNLQYLIEMDPAGSHHQRTGERRRRGR